MFKILLIVLVAFIKLVNLFMGAEDSLNEVLSLKQSLIAVVDIEVQAEDGGST